MIEIINLSLTIGSTEILKNINISFKENMISGLVGRNGSGKTMLMKCICGFTRPTKGEVIIDGKQIGKDVDFPNNIGMIIETPGFIPYYSGYRNLKLIADINKVVSKEEVKATMRLVGLDPELKRHVRKYSLGMKQRLGIAQAIMEKPRLLILDEPFNGLDKKGVEEMRNFLLEYKKGGNTIILCSHSSEDINLLCDVVYEMENGELSERSGN